MSEGAKMKASVPCLQASPARRSMQSCDVRPSSVEKGASGRLPRVTLSHTVPRMDGGV